MKFFENLSNVDLLYAVREDAVSRAKDYEDISLIVCILDYVETVSRKKVKGLLQEIAGYPRDIPLFDITIKGMEYILAGTGTDDEAHHRSFAGTRLPGDHQSYRCGAV